MAKQKTQLANNYTLAVHIRDWVATLLDSKVKPKSLFEVYPDIFSEEMKRAEEVQRQRDWELNKERMRAYAEQFNRRMKKKGE